MKHLLSYAASIEPAKLRPFKKLTVWNLEQELNELVSLAPELISRLGSDRFDGTDEAQHPLEFGDQQTLRQDDNNQDFPFCFSLPQVRQQFREVASSAENATQYHLIHRLLAEDALNQQTIALRHMDVSSMHSIRPWRRMLNVFFHGLQSIPIEFSNNGDPHKSEIKFKCSALTSPIEFSAYWSWIYLFLYRRILERPPAWNLSRFYGLDNLKSELLQLFDQPLRLWPKKMARGRFVPTSDRHGLFEQLTPLGNRTAIRCLSRLLSSMVAMQFCKRKNPHIERFISANWRHYQSTE